jgi:hypothetical protein
MSLRIDTLFGLHMAIPWEPLPFERARCSGMTRWCRLRV